ncbi:MAG: 4'-phosphopantetheinyl transferase family protein [Pseudomonadales bacterium]
MLSLPAEEIHLWFCRPHELELDRSYTQLLQATLDAGELQRMRRFKFERHRQQFCVSHALTRWVLSHYAAVQPEQWQFEKNSHGKPFVSNPAYRDLQFNLSHTEGLQLLAVRRALPVGADVEQRKRRAEGPDIAERFFSAAEVAELRGVPDSDQKQVFFDYWTLKESYIKACGKGLAIPLRHFSYSIAQDAIGINFAPERDDEPSDWQFWLLAAGGNHTCAVAASGVSQATRITRLRGWDVEPMRDAKERRIDILKQSRQTY